MSTLAGFGQGTGTARAALADVRRLVGALRYGQSDMQVTVLDDGRGAAAFGDGMGNGLTGMRSGWRCRVAPWPHTLEPGVVSW